MALADKVRFYLMLVLFIIVMALTFGLAASVHARDTEIPLCVKSHFTGALMCLPPKTAEIITYANAKGHKTTLNCIETANGHKVCTSN